ncbi:hypothetical protein [Arhodomonas sp. AD133]|uniref:hypothetical protein n=1 Tax=Arhodomonas sp. AD133 TaxID=3415009 RepID=UPI003EBBDC9C
MKKVMSGGPQNSADLSTSVDPVCTLTRQRGHNQAIAKLSIGLPAKKGFHACVAFHARRRGQEEPNKLRPSQRRSQAMIGEYREGGSQNREAGAILDAFRKQLAEIAVCPVVDQHAVYSRWPVTLAAFAPGNAGDGHLAP